MECWKYSDGFKREILGMAAQGEAGQRNPPQKSKHPPPMKAPDVRTGSSQSPQPGFEPGTDRLTADCSAVELLWNDVHAIE
jgi:hypothetical protein